MCCWLYVIMIWFCNPINWCWHVCVLAAEWNENNEWMTIKWNVPFFAHNQPNKKASFPNFRFGTKYENLFSLSHLSRSESSHIWSKMAAPDMPSNSSFIQSHRYPQPGILPPPETLALFIEITLKPHHDTQAVKNAIGFTPLVEKPPFIPSNDVNPTQSTKSSPPEGFVTYSSC